MAFVISTVCVRLDPCSGRSDAMMNCGEPEPPYCSLPQDDVGSTDAVRDWLDFPVATPATTSAAPTITTSGIPKRIRFLTRPSLVCNTMQGRSIGLRGTKSNLDVIGARFKMKPCVEAS